MPLWKKVYNFFASICCCSIWKFLNKALKAVIGRERPTFPQHIEDGYSFPSGHVMVGLLLFGTIAYKLLKKTNDQKMKQIILVCTSLIVVVIGMSRLLEGEHF